MPIEKKIEEKTNNEIENHVSISPGSSTIVLPDDLYTSNRDGENFQVDEEGRNENDAAVELLQIETGTNDHLVSSSLQRGHEMEESTEIISEKTALHSSSSKLHEFDRISLFN